jgi:hypothetical protein
MLAFWGLKFIYTIWTLMAVFGVSASSSVCLFRLFERTHLNLHWNWFTLKMDATFCPETSKPVFHGVKIHNTTTNGTTSTLKTWELIRISSSYQKDTLCISNDEEESVRALHGNNRWLLQVSQKHINTLCGENTQLISVTTRGTVRVSKDIGLHQFICMCPLFALPTFNTRRPDQVATYRHQHALKSHVRSRDMGSSQAAFDWPLVCTFIPFAVSGTTGA